MQDRISRLTPDEARAIRISAAGEGRGGMRSKLNAAARAAYCGVECVIGSARDADVVARSLSPRGPDGHGSPGRQPASWRPRSAGSAGSRTRWARSASTARPSAACARAARCSCPGVKRVDGEFEPGSVVELVDVRHPERLIGRGSVAMPSAILRLLRALTTDEVADVLSILFRLRHAPALRALDPEQFADVADLARRGSQAVQPGARRAQGRDAGTGQDPDRRLAPGSAPRLFRDPGRRLVPGRQGQPRLAGPPRRPRHARDPPRLARRVRRVHS